MSIEDIELTTPQAAKLLDYHPEHVRQLIRRKKLRAHQGLRDYKIPYAEILRFQREHVIPNTGRGRPKMNRVEEVPA